MASDTMFAYIRQESLYGWTTAFISSLIFYCLSQLVANCLIPGPSILSRENNRVWRWTNIVVSMIHSSMCSIWTVSCFYDEPKLTSDMIDTYTTLSQTLVSVSFGDGCVRDRYSAAAVHRLRGCVADDRDQLGVPALAPAAAASQGGAKRAALPTCQPPQYGHVHRVSDRHPGVDDALAAAEPLARAAAALRHGQPRARQHNRHEHCAAVPPHPGRLQGQARLARVRQEQRGVMRCSRCALRKVFFSGK